MSERPRRAATCRAYAGRMAIRVCFSARVICLTMKRETAPPWPSCCTTRKKKDPDAPSLTLSFSLRRQRLSCSERSSGKARAYVAGCTWSGFRLGLGLRFGFGFGLGCTPKAARMARKVDAS